MHSYWRAFSPAPLLGERSNPMKSRARYFVILERDCKSGVDGFQVSTSKLLFDAVKTHWQRSYLQVSAKLNTNTILYDV